MPRTIRQLADALVASLTPLDKAKWDHEVGLARAPFQEYANDPVGFSTQVLGNTITPGQVAVLESVRDHRVTVVMSANSVGKTHSGGDLAHWFFHCLPNSKVITAAAPPMDNLSRLLWGEISKRTLDHPELLDGVQQRALRYTRAPDWWLEGRSIPSSGSAEERQAKFSGVHAPFLLFILDEGDAIPDEVYKGIEACLTGGLNRLVVFFNPRYQGGPIQKLIDEGANVVTLDAFGHPNVVTGKTLIPGAVDREITVTRMSKWSRPALDDEAVDENDPMWYQVPDFLDGCTVTLSDGTTTDPLVGGGWRRVKDEYPEMSHIVLARFPGQAVNQLIPRAWIKRAMDLWCLRREMHGDAPPPGIRPDGGLDVADYGADSSCLCLRYGLWVAPLLKMKGMDGPAISRWAAESFHDAGGDTCKIDTIGVGSGGEGVMKRWWEDYDLHGECDMMHRAVPVRVSWNATDDRFRRLREQMMWGIREWLQQPGAMLPPSEALMAQAMSLQYWYDTGGYIAVTKKEVIKDRLRQSPDELEALALSILEGEDNSVPLGFF